jgi:hypothetical protein
MFENFIEGKTSGVHSLQVSRKLEKLGKVSVRRKFSKINQNYKSKKGTKTRF